MKYRTYLLTVFSFIFILQLSNVQATEKNTYPKVKIETSKGDMIVELYPNKSPKTVANFLAYVNAATFNGTIFHRVIKNFMIQGGGVLPDYSEVKANPPVEIEADNGLKNLQYTLAMARTSNPNSATTQFFINAKDNAFLDYRGKTPRGWGYTVFGKVIEGQNIAGAISRVATGAGGPFVSDVPRTPIIIKSISTLADKKATKKVVKKKK